MFFNVDLFRLNGAPLKFYLDGYVPTEINKMATIVEAFGGVHSPPDDDTVVFSEPGIYTTSDRCRFHVKFFHDSIVARKLQDLNKYKLSAIAKVNELGHNNEACPLADKFHNTQCDTSSEQRCEITKSSGSSTVQKFDHLSVSQGNHEVTEQSPEPEEILEESSIGCTNGVNWCKNEDEKLMLYLIIKSTPTQSCGNVWEEVETNTIFTNTQSSPAVLPSRDEEKCKDKLPKHVEQPKVAHQLKSAKSSKIHRFRHYTDDENKKIIEYLIQHDKIAAAGGNVVWRQMVADRILVNPPRTATGLLNHFVTYLQHNYEKYTTSEKALRQFRQRDENRRSKQLQMAHRGI